MFRVGTAGLMTLALLALSARWDARPVTAEARSRPLVVLDPGHGGDDLGAMGNGVVERDSNLDMAFRVRALLAAAGVDVLLTRTSAGRADLLGAREMSGFDATYADLQARVALADGVQANAFVSLHSNYASDPAASGIDAWFNNTRSFANQNHLLADLLCAHVSDQLVAAGYGQPFAQARDEAELVDANGNTSPLFVLGPQRMMTREEVERRGGDPEDVGFSRSAESIDTSATSMPGTLIELLYVSNPDDAALLRDDQARDAMARGIAQGLLEFLHAAGTPNAVAVASGGR